MNCLICRQAETVDGLGSVTFERGEMHFIIKNVSARVCPHCGEVYVGEEVAARLLKSAQELYEAGTLEDVIDYERL